MEDCRGSALDALRSAVALLEAGADTHVVLNLLGSRLVQFVDQELELEAELERESETASL